jgi:pimeloyl-ACP methyl ester carboxylesterase
VGRGIPTLFKKFVAAYTGSVPIYALDSPGFGGSFDPLGMPTMAEYADMLLNATKALGLDKVHLFGHHAGASLAIKIASTDPGRVASLMMIGLVVLTAEERQAFGRVYPQPFELKADGAHLRTMWEYVENIGSNSDLELHHREMIDTASAWQGHIKVYSKIWDQDFSAHYEKISVPMLIMCAQKDILWPMFERAKEMRPDATAVEISGINFQPDDAPEEIAEAIQSYFRGL